MRYDNSPAGPVELRVVEEVFERHAQVLRVRVAGVTIGTTAEHPFWVVGRGWVDARELQPGDRLVGMGGREVPVQEVADAGEWQTVYNFRVAGHHTYFVGCPDWRFNAWTHNLNCVIMDDGAGTVLVVFEGQALVNGVKFATRAQAEKWIKNAGHTLYTVAPTPTKAFPGARVVEIRSLRPDPTALTQRPGADPDKLVARGFFSWDKYTPFQVYVRNGVYYYQNGFTRVENAIRHGVTHLPVIIVSAP